MRVLRQPTVRPASGSRSGSTRTGLPGVFRRKRAEPAQIAISADTEYRLEQPRLVAALAFLGVDGEPLPTCR